MIYQFINDLCEVVHGVRHFFRAFMCKSYCINSHGLSVCDKTKGFCKWDECPKRKGGDSE